MGDVRTRRSPAHNSICTTRPVLHIQRQKNQQRDESGSNNRDVAAEDRFGYCFAVAAVAAYRPGMK